VLFRSGVILSPQVTLGYWHFTTEETSLTTDRITEYSAGAGLEIPAAKLTSSLTVGRNTLDKEAGESSEKLFASANVYLRPDVLRSLGQHMIFVRALYNGFDFTTAANDFRETSVTAGITTSF
jgi:hypothetical protein